MKSSNLMNRLKAAATGAAIALTALVAPASVTEKSASAAADLNYAKALQYSLYLYDANMCGKEVGEKGRLDWRDDCHTYDSSVSTPYGTLDLSGGFHDCGDHVKFGITGAYAATILGWSYCEFKDAFTKIGESDHLKTITDYYCDYFRRCTVMEGSSVKAFCYQVGDGDTDHVKWESPESQTIARPAYFATSGNPCTDVVAETAAALAMNYLNFKNPDDLTYAKALYNFAKTNNKATHSEQSYYTCTSYLDDLALASIILYKATNDSSYNSDCAKWISDSGWEYTSRQPLCWDSVWPAVNALYGKEWNRVAENIDNNKSNTTSEGYYCHNDWGAARYNTALQMEGLVYDKYNNSSSYTSWAKGQMEYLFGANKNNQCYMVGYADNSVKFPHHRAASGFTDFPSENRGKQFAHVLVGALVGGPKMDGSYKDEVDEYTLTEVGVDYNAAFVGALAGLYLKYGSGQSPASSVPGVSGSKPPVTEPPTENPTEPPTEPQTEPPTEAPTQPPETDPTEPPVTDTPVTTNIPTTGGPVVPSEGTNKINVNETVQVGGSIEIDISDLFPSDAEAQKIIINISSDSEIGNPSYACDISMNDGSMKALNNAVLNASGNTGTIEYDVKDIQNEIDKNGKLKFNYWWGNTPLKVDSIIGVYSSDTPIPSEPPTEAPYQPTDSPDIPPTEAPTGNIPDGKCYGNVDNDDNNNINVADLVALNTHLLNRNKYPLSPEGMANADVVRDNIIDASDGSLLLNFLAEQVGKEELGKIV